MTELDEIFNANGKIYLHRDDYPTPEQMKQSFRNCTSVTKFPEMTDEMIDETNDLIDYIRSHPPEPPEGLFGELKSVFISGPNSMVYLGIAVVFTVILWMAGWFA